MADVLPRYYGPVEQLPAGMWCDSQRWITAHPTVADVIRCPSCGGIDHVRLAYDVDPAGVVTPEYRCPTTTCGWRAWIVLDSWWL